MKKSSKIALLSAIAITGAVAGAGVLGTLAYFSSRHQVDVVVNAAKVDVEQSAPTIVSQNLTYANSGAEVKVNGNNAIAANLLVPGDSFLVKVTLTNKSTIGVNYKLEVNAATGLEVLVYTDKACTTLATDTEYTHLDADAAIASPDRYIKITVTDDFENGGTSTVTFATTAIQDSVPLEGYKKDTENKLVNVYSTDGLVNLQKVLATDSIKDYEGYTLTLKSDIDLSSVEDWGGMSGLNRFSLNFDGQGHVIKNMTIKNGTGFLENTDCFATGEKQTVNGDEVVPYGNYFFKNVTFDNAHVVNQDKDNHSLREAGGATGIVAGYTLGLDLEGVTVKNSYVEGYKWTGGLVGYMAGIREGSDYYYEFHHVIKDCHVINTTVNSRKYRSGGMVGYANAYYGDGGLSITDSSVENSTLTVVSGKETTEGARGWFVATCYNGVSGSGLTVDGTAIAVYDQKVNDIPAFDPIDPNTVTIA